MAPRADALPLPLADAIPLVDSEALMALFGVSDATIRRMVRNGRLPTPLRTSAGRTARRFWRRQDIEAAVAAWPQDAAA